MPQAFSLQQILCRPVLERHLYDIKEFCKTIWEIQSIDHARFSAKWWTLDNLGENPEGGSMNINLVWTCPVRKSRKLYL